jgi:hypothetical protein
MKHYTKAICKILRHPELTQNEQFSLLTIAQRHDEADRFLRELKAMMQECVDMMGG